MSTFLARHKFTFTKEEDATQLRWHITIRKLCNGRLIFNYIKIFKMRPSCWFWLIGQLGTLGQYVDAFEYGFYAKHCQCENFICLFICFWWWYFFKIFFHGFYYVRFFIYHWRGISFQFPILVSVRSMLIVRSNHYFWFNWPFHTHLFVAQTFVWELSEQIYFDGTLSNLSDWFQFN